jgi:hypothetical protein
MRKSLQLGEVLPLARVLLFSGIASFLQLEPFGLLREFASISLSASTSVNFLSFFFRAPSERT